MTHTKLDFSDLRAVFINTTLTKSPGKSHTELLAEKSIDIMKKQNVEVEYIRSVDHDIAQGVYPDMTVHGWNNDKWPELYKKVAQADILVLAGPIWLGDNSSEMKKIIERLYAHSGDTNKAGQYDFYSKVGGCLLTGNEDGIKHCAMNILYSLQHIGYTIPPQADAGWVGEAGPGESYGDKMENGKLAGIENDFTNKNTTFMTWNILHMARMLKDNGGYPAHGNVSSEW